MGDLKRWIVQRAGSCHDKGKHLFVCMKPHSSNSYCYPLGAMGLDLYICVPVFAIWTADHRYWDRYRSRHAVSQVTRDKLIGSELCIQRSAARRSSSGDRVFDGASCLWKP